MKTVFYGAIALFIVGCANELPTSQDDQALVEANPTETAIVDEKSDLLETSPLANVERQAVRKTDGRRTNVEAEAIAPALLIDRVAATTRVP